MSKVYPRNPLRPASAQTMERLKQAQHYEPHPDEPSTDEEVLEYSPNLLCAIIGSQHLHGMEDANPPEPGLLPRCAAALLLADMAFNELGRGDYEKAAQYAIQAWEAYNTTPE